MNRLVFVFICVLYSAGLYAAQSNNSNFINGSTVAPGASFQTLANSYVSYPSPSTFTDVNIQNTVGVMIDHASTVYQGTKLDYTYNLRLLMYDPSLTFSSQDISLSVEYDPARVKNYKDKHIYTFSNKVRVLVQILSIIDNQTGSSVSNPADIFMVKTEINIERYYNFTYSSSPTSVTINPVSYSGVYEYEVNWLAQAGAEEYDLEWTWVNTYTATYGSYSSTGLYYDFRSNSSRVRVSGTSFKISNVFDQGVLIVRVRGIGRNPANWAKQVFGAWTVVNDKDLVSALSNTPNNTFVAVNVHEPDLNWQYSATYAEEGKKKEVVSYFDGSLRSRQMVTKSNTSGEVIVAESYYDHQGRKAVESLPVPSMDQSPQIQYYEDFNVNTSLVAYSKDDFDKDPVPGDCEAPTAPFDESAGAGNYYSQLNTFNALPSDEGFNAYLPEADGFPFIRTEFTPDNTGRIRRQGGVGPVHQLDGGHESKYYYGKPLQFELDRLFGNEAGYSRFYKKDMVVDPNGQVSISYKDLGGKVVATALAGDVPTATSSLPSTAGGTKEIETDLLEKDAFGKSETNRINQQGDALVFNSTYLATHTGVHEFNYEVTAPAYTNDCLNPGICFDCTYDLVVRITDDCGVVLAERTEYIGGPELDNTCESPLVRYSSDDVEPILLELEKGNYHIYKELRINRQALDYYLSQMMDSTKGCFKTKAMFIAEELALVDTSGCDVTCDECVAGLGTRDEFVMRGLGSEKDWELAYQNCIEPCLDESKCQTFFRLMLSDVSPGGQYAQWYDTTTGRMNTSTFPLSVFNANNYLPKVSGDTAYWRYPSHMQFGQGYFKENGIRATIPVTEVTPGVFYPEANSVFTGPDGLLYTYPENLKNVADFMLFWENSWARSLVRYHPEYCYFEWCDFNDSLKLNHLSSEDFDNLLTYTDSWSQALTLDVFPSPNIYSLLDKDPYFMTGARGAAQKTRMADILNSTDHEWTGMSIFEIAAVSARCPGHYVSGPLPSYCTAFGTGADSNILNTEWASLRSMYLAEKLKLQDKAAFEYVKANCSKGVNSCIGQKEYNPSLDGITGWEIPSILNDPGKICSDITSYLYTTKIKRFVNMRDLEGVTKAETDYNLYYMTGQCPEAVHLQTFLLQVAQEGTLLSTFSLENKTYFQRDMYSRINGGITSTYVPYQYVPTVTGNKLEIKFRDPFLVNSSCTIKLEIPTPYTFGQIRSFKNLIPEAIPGDPNAFKITAMVDHDGDASTPTIDIDLIGTSCVPVTGCQFETLCESNDFGLDLVKLMNFMRQSTGNDLFSALPVNLETAPYDDYMTDYIKNNMSPITGDRRWRFFGNKFYLYSSDPMFLDYVEIEFLLFDPGSFTHDSLTKIEYIAKIQPDPLNNHGFYMVAYYDDDLNPLTPPRPVTLKGRFNFSNIAFDNQWVLGRCVPRQPAMCQTPEHLTKNDLAPFLNRLVTYPPVTTTALSAISQWTRLLQGQLGTGNYKIGAPQSYYDSIVYDIISDEFTPGIFKTICKLKLYRIDPYFNNRYDLSDIVALRTIIVDRDMLIDGKAFGFTILAEHSNGVTERIGGYTSCLPVKDCECPKSGGGGEGGGGGGKTEDCEARYRVYAKAIEMFNNNFFGNNPIPSITVPLIPKEDFNCECGADYVAYLKTYAPPATFKSLETFCGTELCKITFNAYLDAINAFNASHPPHMHLTPDPVAGELCDCLGQYIDYLMNYTGTTKPKTAIEFAGALMCIPDEDCAQLKDAYRSAILAFNGSPFRNPDSYVMAIEDIDTGDCKCLRSYILYLNAVNLNTEMTPPMPLSAFCPPVALGRMMQDPSGDDMETDKQGLKKKDLEDDGEQNRMMMMSGKEDIIIENSSIYTPSYSPASTCVKFSYIGPEFDYVNRCAEHLRHVAEVNATIKYNEYLEAFKANHTQLYTQHCLTAAQEVFDLEYEDKMYHYTLYYYDQAGNLIRTVPPAGVNLVTSPTDFAMISLDRALKTRKFFTSHTLVTTYEYNSLNQMVKQSVPDHDKMNRWYVNASNPVGKLPTGFIAKTSYAVNASTTIIAGTISGEGYIFRTDDAGFNWYRVGEIEASDLNEIQMADASNGYAVGKDGLLYTTVNGGVTWKIVPGALGIDEHLNDLHFKNANDGVVVGNNGQVWITSNAGTSWSASSTSITGDIVSISGFNSTDLIISVNNAGEGLVFRSTNFGTNWTQVNNYRTDELGDVFMISTTEGFAGGKDGVFLHTTDAGTSWNLVATNVHLNFRKIHFKDASNGYAILETSGTGGNIFTTSNGGQTWKQASAIGVYRDFSFYTSTKGYAVGNNNGKGILARLDLDLLTVAKLGDRTDLADDLYAVHFIDANTGFVGGDDGKLFQCTNASSNFMAWTAISITAPYNTEDIRKIYFNSTTLGAFVTASGKLVTKNGGTYTDHNGSSQNYVNLKEGFGRLFVVDKNSYGQVWYSTSSSLAAFSSLFAYTSTNNPSTATVNAVHPISSGSVFVVGSKGLIISNSTLQHDNVDPVEINDVFAVASTTTGYAAGKDGSLWITSNSGTNWAKMITGTSKELFTLGFSNSTTGLAGGLDGTLLAISGITVSPVSASTVKTIMDISYLNSNDVAISGSNGLLKKSSNAGSSWTDAGTNTLANTGDIAAVHYLGSGNILAVGSHGYVWKSTGTALTRVTDLLLPELNDLHFANGKQGVLAGDKGALLLSEDGGSNWKLIPALAGIKLNSAWRMNANTLFVADNNNNIRKSVNTGVSFTTPYSGSNIIRDLAFENTSNGVAVGHNGTVLYTTDGGNTWTGATVSGTLTTHLYAVQMKNNRGFIAGAGGKMLTSVNSGINWNQESSGTTEDLYAIYFHDYYTGYILGNNGTLRKTVDGGIKWVAKDNYNPATSPGTQHLYTIAFNTRFDGFFAGNDYPRRLKDEADLFSGFFYYDKLGRLTVSENTKQFNKANFVYTYTLFDYQGRTTETGEITQTTDVRNLYPTRLMDDVAYQAWISGAISRKEVTQNHYDFIIDGTLSIPGFSQDNLRKRVASVTYEETYDSDNLTYTNAIHYTYDIHGNVTSLIQDNPALQTYNRRYLRMDYKYDLVSGNVNSFHYQDGEIDQWHHRYFYDADNRITEVHTSKDNIVWDVDGRYEYYRHGTSARTELGDLKVQGIDYAYTLQGWLKGVNSNTLDPDEDMGIDGSTYTPHKTVARDAFGYTLGYYAGDYKAVNGMSSGPGFFVPATSGSDLLAHRSDFFNGNISMMVTSIINPSTNAVLPQGYAYQYDQLKRLKQMRAFSNFNVANNQFNSGGGTPVPYAENFSYDANGNILTLSRNGLAGNTAMDNLSFRYDYFHNNPGLGMRSNRLYHVDDAVTSTYTDDIDDQGTFAPDSFMIDVNVVNNYSYDEMGNLVKDNAEEIQNIEWNVAGKIKKITRTLVSTKSDLEFIYDAMGKRIAKIERPKPLNPDTEKITWYAKDAQGNSIVTYDQNYNVALDETYLVAVERNIFGSSRLGMQAYRDTVYGTEVIPPVANYTERILGTKRYEGTNHLGNVLVVVNDKKIPHDINTDNVIDYYTADIRSSHDYYSFGSPMPGRNLYAKETNCYTITSMGTTAPVTNGHMGFWNPYMGGIAGYDPIDLRQEIMINNPGDGASYIYPGVIPSVPTPGVTVTNTYTVNVTAEATTADAYVAVYDASNVLMAGPMTVPGGMGPQSVTLNYGDNGSASYEIRVTGNIPPPGTTTIPVLTAGHTMPWNPVAGGFAFFDALNNRQDVMVNNPGDGAEIIFPTPSAGEQINVMLMIQAMNNDVFVEITPMGGVPYTVIIPAGGFMPVNYTYFSFGPSCTIRVTSIMTSGIYPDNIYIYQAEALALVPTPLTNEIYLTQTDVILTTVTETLTCDSVEVTDYRFGFNGLEKDNEVKGQGNHISFGDYGYDPRINRRWRRDPKAAVLPNLSPYLYGLNNPINVIDPDGKFPILINGEVGQFGPIGNGSQRASSSYWGTNILSTVTKQTGYAQSTFKFVDGDQGGTAATRKTAGIAQGKLDAQAVWNQMKENLNSEGKVTEQLQVITHSKGSAYGAGYMESLETEIKALAKKDGIGFAYDEGSIVEYSVNLAPHQSNSINYSDDGTKNVNISHIGDLLSGNDATGNVINVHSIPEKDSWPLEQHSVENHNTELNFVLNILENNKDKSKLLTEVKKGYENYDNSRTNGDKSTVTEGKK